SSTAGGEAAVLSTLSTELSPGWGTSAVSAVTNGSSPGCPFAAPTVRSDISDTIRGHHVPDPVQLGGHIVRHRRRNHNLLRSSRHLNQCHPPLTVQLREDIVEQQHGFTTTLGTQQFVSG